MKRFLLILAASLYGWVSLTVSGQTSAVVRDDLDEGFRTRRSAESVPGQLLVVFRPGVSTARQGLAVNSILGQARFFTNPLADARVQARSLGTPSTSIFNRLALLTVDPLMTGAAVQRLRSNPDVLTVEPNYRVRLATLRTAAVGAVPGVSTNSTPGPVPPNDFEFGNLWGMENHGQTGGKSGADIKALRAWEISHGSTNVVVAVIDTGLDYFHPDLETNVWTNGAEIPGNGIDDDGNGYIDDVHGFDFVSHDGDPLDDNIHGTHVAGTIGASGNNGIGVAGVCWSVRLMALKAFDEKGDGDSVQVIEAIRYAVANGAKVINASWGLAEKSHALEQAVTEALQAGIVFVAAAGNEKNDVPFYPAAYPDVISVAATDHKDARSLFSNFGAYLDVGAPGENIFSTTPNVSYQGLNGTSMAAPHVSGLSALILSRHPEFKQAEVASIIQNTADFIPTDRPIGSGRINAYEAMLVNEPLPIARLRLPKKLAGHIAVFGTANGPSFVSYSLRYGKGSFPTNWVVLSESTTPVDDGVLLEDFATEELEEGDYTVELTVRNDRGQAARQRSLATVSNVELAFPLSSDVLRAGGTLSIQGTVFGRGRTFRIEYGMGFEPAEWSDSGITLAQGPPGSFVNTELARWDTRMTAPNQFYALRLTSTNSAAGTQVTTYSIYLDSKLKPGWPQYLPVTGDYPLEDWRHVTVADLDRDGFKEILVVDHGNSDDAPARLIVYEHTGAIRWTRNLGSGQPYVDIPVVGDIDNDGIPEIFVDIGPILFAFKADGSPVPGKWPLRLDVTNLGKVLADVDGDGFLDLIALAQGDPADNTGARQLLRIDRLGNVVQKWDVPFCGDSLNLPKLFPCVANFDDDADLEIAVVSGCSAISLFDVKQGAPVWMVNVDGKIVSSPVAGDITGDHRNAIVVGVNPADKGGPGGVYAWTGKGSLLRGWPILLQESFTTSPALADFNGDGAAEISIASTSSRTIHLIKADGFELEGWPVGPYQEATMASTPVMGDIDGDGKLDVVLASPASLFLAVLNNDYTAVGGVRAWTARGQVIDLNGGGRFPAIMFESSLGDWSKAAAPTLADIDNDGKLDIIGSSIMDRTYLPVSLKAARKFRSSIYVWGLETPFDAETLPWPAFRQNARQTGFLPRKVLPPVAPKISPIPNQTVAPGQPFFPIWLDQYVEDSDTPLDRLTWFAWGNSALRLELTRDRRVLVSVPDPDWAGEERVWFLVRDPTGLASSNSVVFSVKPGYKPPVPGPDQMETLEDSPVTLNVLKNDADPDGRQLSIFSVSKPGFGVVDWRPDGEITYTPARDKNGTDSFSYVAGNNQGGVAMGLVTIRVRPVNDAPVAVPDRVITAEDTPVEFDLLENDFDPDSDSIRLVSFTLPELGALRTNGAGRFTYSPKTNAFGTDTFMYTIADPSGATNSGIVSIMIKPVNDLPILHPEHLTLNKNSSVTVSFSAEDPDGDEVTYKAIGNPEHGDVWAFPTIATYYPTKGYSGPDSFTYTASDGKGEPDPITVFLTVLDANNPPVTQSQDLATKSGQPLKIELTATDADEDAITFKIVAQPAHGSVAAEGKFWMYTPDSGYLGQDSFQFRATDGKNDSPAATVSIKVTDQNTAPTARDFSIQTKVNIATNFTLQASDPEGNPLSYVILTNPVQGTLSGTAPELIYTPNPEYVGPDRFLFKVSDGEFESDPATVLVTVRLPNSPPVAALTQTLVVRTNERTQFGLKVTDIDGDALICPILKGPSRGILSGLGTNLVYVPRIGFAGTDSFTYKPWDGHSYGNEGKVTITVSALPPIEPKIKTVGWGTNGVSLTLQLDPGKGFDLQSSTNLTHWTSLFSGRPDGLEMRLFDTNAAGSRTLFYRLRQQ